jgi:argininosuccinate lyase
MAHSAVGQAVRLCLDKKCELQALSLEELRTIRAEFDQDFYPALELQAVLDSHNVPGGTASSQVAAALKSVIERVKQV